MSQPSQIESFTQPNAGDVSSLNEKLALEAYPGTNDSTALAIAGAKKSATDVIDKMFGNLEIFDRSSAFEPKRQTPGQDNTSQRVQETVAHGPVTPAAKPGDAANPAAKPGDASKPDTKPESGTAPTDGAPASSGTDTTLGKAPEKTEVPAKDSPKVDRSKIEDLAERLHGDGGLGIGDWGREDKREEMAWSGELQGRLKSLNADERAALKGIYHEKYGKTLDADYAFLKGDSKKEFDAVMHQDDPAAQKADRLMLLMDKSKEDYKTLSYAHQDRANANKELRDTLKSMNEKEIQETDAYFRRCYGKSLKETLDAEAPKTTQEMCSIYLKGQDKLTAADNQKLTELTNEEQKRFEANPNLTAKDAERLFNKNFERLDWNEDGVVSRDEIDRAMNDSDYRGEDAQLVVLLKQKREELAVLSKDSNFFTEKYQVTKQDMAKLTELANKTDKSKEEQEVVDTVDRRLRNSGNAIKDSDKRLWGKNSNPIDSITPDAVDQEKIGDCYFLASVAAVAKTKEGKESIKNMIEDNKDGTYTVRFPGNPRSITVDEPTDAELAHGAAAGKEGVWVAVLEKAYAKYKYKETGEKPRYPTDGIDGGYTNEALELLTGKRVKDVSLENTSKDEMHKILKKSMEDDRPVTCEIDDPEDDETESKKEENPAGLPTGHSYTVTGYDPETRMVTVRNPWGSGEPEDADGNAKDGKNDGTFTMTLDEFYRNFHSVQYARADNDKDKEKDWWNPFD